MKIRTSYVSNSSSSSFVIIGEEIGSFHQITQLDFASENKYFIKGDTFCDGIDLIELNEKLFNFFRLNLENLRIADSPIIKAETVKFNTSINGIPSDKIKGKRVFTGDCDYRSTKTIRSASRYIGLEEEE